MTFEIRILGSAEKALKQFDKPVAKRIVERIFWLAENIAEIQPAPLKANLTGFFKLRVGNYRVIYEILEDESTIIIHLIGHRSEIYKK